MEKTVLSKKETKKALENYIFVKLNKDEDIIPEHIQTQLTPTFIFLDSTGNKVLDTIKGTMSKDDFIEYITEIYNQEKS